MTAPDGTNTPAPPAGEGNPSGGDDGANPRVFTEDEVERKLRGKASEVERANKAREAAEAKLASMEATAKQHAEAAMAEQGKWKELAEQRASELKAAKDALSAELKERESRLAALEEREAKRREEIAAKNKERIKALPDEVKKGIPKSLDPEALADVLTTIEGLIPGDKGGGRFGGSPRPASGGSPEQTLETINAQFHDLMMGRRPGASR